MSVAIAYSQILTLIFKVHFLFICDKLLGRVTLKKNNYYLFSGLHLYFKNTSYSAFSFKQHPGLIISNPCAFLVVSFQVLKNSKKKIYKSVEIEDFSTLLRFSSPEPCFWPLLSECGVLNAYAERSSVPVKCTCCFLIGTGQFCTLLVSPSPTP